MDPVADVAAVAVEPRAHPVDQVGHLPGDELLHVLVGPVVVGAVGDGRAQAERPHPGAHEHVGGCLGGAVGRARVVRRLLGEASGVAQRQVAVDLVGGDVVVAHIVFAARLDQGVGSPDVGLQEGRGVGDGVVVVGLGGVVHHASARPTRRSTSAASQMSPTTSSTRLEGSPAMFSGLPA